jgi:hypothetical protein
MSNSQGQALFSRLEKDYGDVTLSDYLPDLLAKIATREADINNLPIAGMLSVIFMLTCIFSPAAYVAGMGTNVQPLILLLGNIGQPSINKTGLHDLCIRIFREVTVTLDKIRRDFGFCKSHNMFIPKSNLPALDKSSTLACAMQHLGNHRNNFRCDDEHKTYARMLSNSGEGAASSRLELFNGPPVFKTSTKSTGHDLAYVPRSNQISWMHPATAEQDRQFNVNKADLNAIKPISVITSPAAVSELPALARSSGEGFF